MSYSIRSCRLYIRLPPGNMGQKIQTGTIPALRDVDHEVGINDLSPRCANLFFHIQPARIPRTPNATRTQSASLVVLLCVDCRIILGVKHASVHLLLCMVGRRQSLSIDSAARWCGSPVPITAARTGIQRCLYAHELRTCFVCRRGACLIFAYSHHRSQSRCR